MAHVSLYDYEGDAFFIPTSGGAFVDGASNQSFCAFDDTAVTEAYTKNRIMPEDYAGGTLKLTIVSMTPDETVATEESRIDVAIYANTPGTDTDDLDGTLTYGTTVSLSVVPEGDADASNTTTFVFDTAAKRNSIAKQDMFHIKITRQPGHADDTGTGDFRIYAMELWEDTA